MRTMCARAGLHTSDRLLLEAVKNDLTYEALDHSCLTFNLSYPDLGAILCSNLHFEKIGVLV